MPMNLNDAAPQMTFEVIPDGTFAKILLQVKPGGYSFKGCEQMDAGLFRTPKEEGGAVTMECEFTVLEGPYVHRKFIGYWTVSGGQLDDKGHSKGWGIAKSFIRAAIESNQGIRPDDMGPQAVATRQINGLKEIDNLWFYAKIDVEPGNEYTDQMTGATKQGFDKNKIGRIVTPDMPEYADLVAGEPVAAKPSGAKKIGAKKDGAAAAAPAGRSWGAPAAELPLGDKAVAAAAPAAEPANKPAWLRK